MLMVILTVSTIIVTADLLQLTPLLLYISPHI